MLIDLLFDVAAEELADPNWTYEDQLRHFQALILPDYTDFSALIDYGQQYKLSSKYMFPGKPEK